MVCIRCSYILRKRLNSIKVISHQALILPTSKAARCPEKTSSILILYIMDSNNYKDVTGMAKSEQDISKVRLIMKEVNPDINQPVPDPWGLTEQHYQDGYEMLDKATDKIIEKHSA